MKKPIFNNKNTFYTGRYFIIPRKKNIIDIEKLFRLKFGFEASHTNDFRHTCFKEDLIDCSEMFVYNDLDIALVGGNEEQVQTMKSLNEDFFLEPEKIVYIPDDIPNDCFDHKDANSTWGIDVTRTSKSQYTGKDVKVAILDTGFSKDHPDFISRNIVADSFVPREDFNDEHGHGTHCTGIACGFQNQEGLRYGIAKESEIYIGKVLSNRGSGAQSWVLNGITWAINNECKVISMSLGSRVFAGQGYDIAYERAASFALSKGSLIVAAAGNDSARSQNVYNPVGSPANCPSVLCVAALDESLNVADFSNKAINSDGEVNIAAPGVNIYSSWLVSEGHKVISGTSMATPFVAGVIALLWEKFPKMSPGLIIKELIKIAQNLPNQVTEDVGSGLVIAP